MANQNNAHDPADSIWAKARDPALIAEIEEHGLHVNQAFLQVLALQEELLVRLDDDLDPAAQWVKQKWARQQPINMCKEFVNHPDYRNPAAQRSAIDAAVAELSVTLRIGNEESLDDVLFPQFLAWCAVRMTHQPKQGELWEFVCTMHHYNLVNIIEAQVNRIYEARDSSSASEHSDSGSAGSGPVVWRRLPDLDELLEEDVGLPRIDRFVRDVFN
ncbi:hypothetical protein SISSUDRAFT_1037319 [Sistotremastrum suecicum HHB10207 ss-3]|uniref:Uncharacterized protein n=1 Tax=Sistotremastrum suecicum HHB10207 ss-3 TaxID=1314776 RepID=A0A165YB00_9AGAM|nr:hypothetical protein SISSUDRAFT_1037319 [Sistotremastrum suecicum HHB10207 ss-3]